MIDRRAAEREAQQPGILQLIADGMSYALAAPWLLLVPILIEVYFLLVPGVGSQPLTTALGRWVSRQESANADDVSKWLLERGNWNIGEIVGLLFSSVVDSLDHSDVYRPIETSMRMAGPWAVALLATGMVLVGAALFVVYEVALARNANLIRTPPASFIATSWNRFVKFIAFALCAAILLAFLTVIALVPVAILAVGGISSGAIASILALIGLAMLILLMFVPEAIIVDGLWPLSAMRASATVVVHSFWRALGFYIISLMIGPGLLSAWKAIAHQAVGLALAVTINAWLMTSLAIATLGFYRARSNGLPIAQSPNRG
jgi:hypothetical protein